MADRSSNGDAVSTCSRTVTGSQRRDALRNRAALLTAAAELFADRGLEVTLDDIARHAGVGVGTAYRNFANKDVLIDDLLVSRMAEMVELADRAIEHEDAWLGLRGFLEQALELQLGDRGLKQLLYERSHCHERVDLVRTRLTPAVTRLVERAQRAGALRADVVASDIPMINIMLGTVQNVSRDVAPGLYRRYLEVLLRGLRADGPLPEPALTQDQVDVAMRTWHAR